MRFWRRGSKVVWCFDEVACVGCVQRAGVLRTADKPRPYKASIIAL